MVVVSMLVAGMVGTEVRAQNADSPTYVAERVTVRSADAVSKCLKTELNRRPRQVMYTVVKVSETGNPRVDAAAREVAEARVPSTPKYIDYHSPSVARQDDRTVAQVVARTALVETHGRQVTQTPVPVRREARERAHAALEKCAPEATRDENAAGSGGTDTDRQRHF